MRAVAATLPAAALLAAAGCTSPWVQYGDRRDLVTTEVVIRTVPPGAPVYWDDTLLGTSPLRLPVEYDHFEQYWERQAPVRWLGVPTPVHEKEEMRRHVYGSNRHSIKVLLDGYDEVRRDVELQGEREVVVEFKLDKSR